MYKGAFRSPYFIFFPFLLFYAYVIVINKWPTLYGDEIRYVDFAHNLIHGFYSPPMPHINLWNGPGYPLVLYPLIKWKIPVLYITLLNALYQYLAVVPDLTNNQYPSGFVSEQAIKQLKKNHATELNFILKHNEMEQDQLFKQFAIRNIETHPLKFITNYYYNVARMLFNFPYSYSSQDGAIVGNIIRGIIFPVKLLLFVTAVYLLLSGALSAYPRQLDVVVPVLLFWIAYLGAKGLGLNLRFTQQLNLDEIDLTDLPGIALPSEEKLKHPGSL
eukprot:gene5009-5057_t